LERKVGAGSKGTIYEEEYLLKSITKLVTRYNVTQGKSLDPSQRIPHCLILDIQRQAK
jgi:elongator complex protein 1